MKDRDFLTWLHERLEFQHGENPNVDYMQKLRSIIVATDPDQLTPNTGPALPWSLFLDDERHPPRDGRAWRIARNHSEVVNLIDMFGYPEYVSFDHDLGDFIPNGDGYQIAKYLCDLDMNTSHRMPDNFDFYVHSQNPVGAENIRAYMRRYIQFRQSSPRGKKSDV